MVLSKGPEPCGTAPGREEKSDANGAEGELAPGGVFTVGAGEVGGEGASVRPIAGGRLTPRGAQQQPEAESQLPAPEARRGRGGRDEIDLGEEPVAFVVIEMVDGDKGNGHGG